MNVVFGGLMVGFVPIAIKAMGLGGQAHSVKICEKYLEKLAICASRELIIYLAMMLPIILSIAWILLKLRAVVRRQFPLSRTFVQCPCNRQQHDFHTLLHETNQIVSP